MQPRSVGLISLTGVGKEPSVALIIVDNIAVVDHCLSFMFYSGVLVR